MKMDIKRVCDKCFQTLKFNDTMYGFKIVDDFGFERIFQGHKECVEEMQEIMNDLYEIKGEKGKNSLVNQHSNLVK